MSVSESHHSQQKIKLCQQIIHDHFGPTAAAITAVLLARGRLSIPLIVKFLNSAPSSVGAVGAVGGSAASAGVGVPRGGPLGIGGSSSSSSSGNAPTRISPATVEHTLLSLIQHNCAWHVLVSSATGAAVFGPALKDLHAKIAQAATSEGGGAAAAASIRAGYQEFFEINPDEIIPRLRFGSYIGMAEERFGSDAADIIQLILKHGKLQARDICDKLGGDDPLKSTKIARLLLLLLHRTYIRPSLASSHISPRDKFIAYEVEGKQKRRGSVFTPKELRELKEGNQT